MEQGGANTGMRRLNFELVGWMKKIHLHQFGSTYCNPLRTQEPSLRKLILSVSHPEIGQLSSLTLGCLATKWDLCLLLYWLLDFVTWTKSFFQLSQYSNLQKALAGTSGLPSLPGNLSVSINRWMKKKVFSILSILFSGEPRLMHSISYLSVQIILFRQHFILFAPYPIVNYHEKMMFFGIVKNLSPNEKTRKKERKTIRVCDLDTYYINKW